MSGPIQLVYDARAEEPLTPYWESTSGTLVWADASSGTVCTFCPESQQAQVCEVGWRITAVLPGGEGRTLVVCDEAVMQLRTADNALSELCRFGDLAPPCAAAIDPAGRLLLASADDAGRSMLALIDSDLAPRRTTTPLPIGGAMCFSADGRTLFALSAGELEVRAFDYHTESGVLSRPRAACRIAEGEGLPRGMAVDAAGGLWIAHWGGDRVSRWDPAQEALTFVAWVPVSQVAGCAFGGAEMKDLYIITGRTGLGGRALEAQPFAGALFRAETDQTGAPLSVFSGA